MAHDQTESGGTVEREELISRFQSVFGILDWQSARIKEQILSPFYLTIPQVNVLTILSDEGKELEMPTIAAKAELPPGAVTSILDRLFLRRLAQRRDTPANGRRTAWVITDEGKELLRELGHRRTTIFEELVAPYSDKELEHLLDLFLRWTTQGDRVITAGNRAPYQSHQSETVPTASRRPANALRDFRHR